MPTTAQLDAAADRWGQARSHVYGRNIEPELTNPFRRIPQSVLSRMTSGLVSPVSRYKEGEQPFVESDLTPEEMQRWKSLPRSEQARLAFDNPTGFLHILKSERDALLKPQVGQSLTGKIAMDERRDIITPGQAERQRAAGDKTLPAPSAFVKLKGELDAGLLTGAEFGQAWDSLLKRGTTTIHMNKATKAEAKAKGSVANIGDLLTTMDAMPRGAAGARGQATSWVAGLLGQFSEEVAQEFSDLAIGGHVDRADLLRFQTKLKAYAVEQIAVLTGEESGRVTEMELQIAKDAAGTVGPSTDFVKQRAAVSTIAEMRILNDERLRVERGEAPEYPVGSEAEVEATVDKLMRQGFPDDLAELIAMRLIGEFAVTVGTGGG